MKIYLLSLLLFASAFISAQTGSIVGKLTDQEYNNEPLPFANVLIKGTTIGTTSDFDGLYEISGLDPGTYTVVFSFLGYETVEIPNIVVESGKVTNVDVPMSASAGVALEEVTVVTVARRDSETALLLDQKRAIEIKESIGAVELGNLGISDVKAAATKISGVTESEASGDVFVRGLGDRYLTTTFNSLPIPSDDIEKKNIDLGLFPTRVIQNVSISKTYSATNSADQASGNINIASRELSGTGELEVGISTGANLGIYQDGVADDFRSTANFDDTNLGFYDTDINIESQVTEQSWDAGTIDNPFNRGVNLAAGKSFFDNKFKVFLTASNSRSHGYRTPGVFLVVDQVDSTGILTDFTEWESRVVNNGLLDLTFQNDKNIVKSVTLFVNTLTDLVAEAGRNGLGNIQEETLGDFTDFLRDQNTKQTRLFVTQLIGNHKLSDKNVLDWAIGYNKVNADEPNRIRNVVNFTEETGEVILFENSGFESRKLAQFIDDEEYNGLLKDRFKIIDEDDSKRFYIDLGVNYRRKTRDFVSSFFGVANVDDNRPSSNSLDELDQIFTQANFNNNLLEILSFQSNEDGEVQDEYQGEYESYAGFANFNVGLGKWNFNAGLRMQVDEIVVDYDVANAAGGDVGSVLRDYSNFYPSLNIKYSINDEHAIRFAASRSITLPEFKEIAPFRYISPTGQQVFGTVGEDAVEASFSNNFDLKWEYFPTRGQLVSASLFYKNIEDPINKVRARGSDGALFTFRNTGDNARIFGIEFESKIDIIKPSEYDDDGNTIGPELSLVLNASRMWHEQDLLEERAETNPDIIAETFRYGTNFESGLQGASDWIANASLNLETSGKNKFVANLSGSFASDKIFALGFARSQQDWDTRYNDAILEKGFVVLNSRVSKQFGNLEVSLSAQNLLNPRVRQTTDIITSESRAELEAFSDDRLERLGPDAPDREIITSTVRSYKFGRTASLGLSYTF